MKVVVSMLMTAVAATLALQSAFAEGELAISAPSTFRLRTGGGSFAAPYASVSDWAISWRDGETVSATGRDGTTVITINGNSSAPAGSAVFVPTMGGVWTLENSNGAKAYIGVDWSMFNDGWSLDSGAVSARLETKMDGPDRKARRKSIPPVAYSGDDWTGDITKAATLTFTSPSGARIVIDRTGGGTYAFSFDEIGEWTVVLDFEDGGSRTAKINVKSSGMMIVIR